MAGMAEIYPLSINELRNVMRTLNQLVLGSSPSRGTPCKSRSYDLKKPNLKMACCRNTAGTSRRVGVFPVIHRNT